MEKQYGVRKFIAALASDLTFPFDTASINWLFFRIMISCTGNFKAVMNYRTPNMTQTEIRLEEPGNFLSRDAAVPDIPPGHARVRVRRIGVCGTDIHAFYGRQPFFEYPRILGHELGAEIVEINGNSNDFQPGDAVTIEPYLNNPESAASRKGKTNCCENLEVLGVHCDGGMRPYITVPISKLHGCKTATLDQLALVEMLCIGRHAVNRSKVTGEQTVLVIGSGPIGMSVLQFLQTETSQIAVADLDENRLAFCKESMGVTNTIAIEPGKTDLESKLREQFGGELPDVIFDATGNQHSMAATFDCIAHGGTIVLVGLFQGELSFHDPNFHRREITLMSSRNATSPEFGQVISAMESGEVDTSPWITHRMNLADVPGQFEKVVSSPSLRKAMIHVDDD